MKKFYFLVASCLMLNIVTAQTINIPDSNFLQALIDAGIDTNGNGSIEYLEAVPVTYLGITNRNIQYLGGIENFTNLRDLSCAYNQINDFAPLGILQNLETLDCSANQIVDFSSIGFIQSLRSLICSNNQITNLSALSNLHNLRNLDCSGNLLTAASFTGSNLSLVYNVNCSHNQIENLTSLVAFFPNLTTLDCSHNLLTTFSPLSSLSQLGQLSCGANMTNSLSSISSLVNLIILNCSSMQLTALNEIYSLVNLSTLYCDDNQLTAEDFVSHWPNLGSLSCSNNLLTTLNMGSSTNLSWLYCDHNQLTVLDVSGLSGLSTLFCTDNQITSLSLSSLQYLYDVACTRNQLSTLDVSSSPYIYRLDCSDNQLTSLFMKNGGNESNCSFSGNPGLTYICADESQIVDVQSKITQYGYTNCHVNSYCSFTPGGTFYTIQGNNKYDSNANGCDASDIAFPNLKLNFSDGTNTGNIIADATGNYHYDVQAGTQTITPIVENPMYFNISPVSAMVSFPTASSPFMQDFCVSANGVHNDLEVSLLPRIAARPGFDSTYKIRYKNKGTQMQSGTISFAFNDAVLDLVNATPAVSSQVINYLNWNFTDLLPFETREITVTLNVNAPTEVPPVFGGDILNFTASANSSLTDETPNDNTSVLNQTVVNSFDPNDKTCLEGSIITPEMVGKEVHYLIRFENTGTANAQNIVVKDMIDTTKFDVSSLIPMDGSHPFVTKISDTNKVEFIFENINLPFDDANNDGYVAFKIKTKPTLVSGDSFSNTASIYFDYNYPIITNTAVTTIAALAIQDFALENYIAIHPNPAHDLLNIETKKAITIFSISIYNTLGQVVLVIPNAQQTKSVDVSSLKTGNYFMKVDSDKGSSNMRFVKN